MDTEATYTVCTSNFDEFVFLYSKGLAIDLPTNWVMFFSYVNKGIELISPYEEYTPERMTEMDVRKRNDFYFYDIFSIYVVEKMKLLLIEILLKLLKRR
jgi:hypothetical protein